MFNYFDPRSQLWRELGDRNLLKSMDKLYFVTVRNSPPDRYLAGGSRYRHLPMLTPSNVMLLPVERPTELELVIGDDLSWATEAGLAPKVTCHVQVSGGAKVAATLNGRPLGNPAVKDDWLDFPVPSECVKKGANRLALLAPPAQQPPPKMPQWTLVYDGAKPPAEPWQKTGFAGKCLAEVRDGRLLIADRDTVTGSYAFFTNRCSVRPSDRTVFEVRLKPISGWSSVMIENGVSGLEVQFFTDKVVARGSGLSYTMDTTDAFHTYRIAICDKDFQLFVDGVLRIDGAGKFTQPASGGRSGVMFGAANSGSLGEALWESVKLHNAAQTIYDAVLSVRYKR